MGMGDEIMVLGEVKRQAKGRTAKWAIIDARRNSLRWEDIWHGNPLIAHPGQQFSYQLINHPGNRPYIGNKMADRWRFKPYGPEAADIYLRPSEEEFANATKGRVIIHPDLKPNASVNKDWGFARWQKLVNDHPQVPWMQIGAPLSPRLGVPFLQTPSFRAAVGALKGARAAVLQEGGLHHAAAAVKLNAVVIFGGFISPDCTGYPSHVNLFKHSDAHPYGCGMRQACAHCAEAMSSFSPAVVFNHLEKML